MVRVSVSAALTELSEPPWLPLKQPGLALMVRRSLARKYAPALQCSTAMMLALSDPTRLVVAASARPTRSHQDQRRSAPAAGRPASCVEFLRHLIERCDRER